MKNKIVATDKEHLKKLINHETRENGYKCDLNHLDVSKIINMNYLFEDSKFNGDISNWDVSNVEEMSNLFSRSKFNGDISNWNVSKVKDMSSMFSCSEFNGDISNWTPFNLSSIHNIFGKPSYDWQPFLSKYHIDRIQPRTAPIPYWAKFDDMESRNKAIEVHVLEKELVENLPNNKKKLKI
jgi:surface protein